MQGSVFAVGVARSHDSLAAVTHDVIYILEIDVDVPCHRDDLRYAFRRYVQHVVGSLEGLGELHVAVLLTEFVIADDEQCIDVLPEFRDAVSCLLLTAFAFEAERQCDDADRQYAEFACYLRHDGSCAGAGAAAHTGGDEQHLRVRTERLTYPVLRVFSRLAARRRDVARTEHLVAEVQLILNRASLQSLVIGVADDEIHTRDAGLIHVRHSVAAAAADTHHLDNVGPFV